MTLMLCQEGAMAGPPNYRMELPAGACGQAGKSAMPGGAPAAAHACVRRGE